MIALLGLALTASAAFGGFDKLAKSVRDHVYCDVIRDCGNDDPPETRLVAGPHGVSADGTPTFRFDSDKKVNYRCRIDERPFHACRNPYTSHRLKDGDHAIEVFAIDRHHNKDATPAHHKFTVDTDSPNSQVVRGPRTTRDRSPVFGLHSDERNSKFEYRLDREGKFRRTGSEVRLYGLRPGKHLLEVRSVDKAGNADPSPAKRFFQVVGKHNS